MIVKKLIEYSIKIKIKNLANLIHIIQVEIQAITSKLKSLAKSFYKENT